MSSHDTRQAPVTLVIGPGSIGRLVALHLQDHNVNALTRDTQIEVRLLGRRTLPTRQSLTDPDGKHRSIEIATLNDPSTAARHATLVHVTTKAYATDAAFSAIAPYLPGDTPIVLWQNGMRVQRPLTRSWSGPVLCASTTEGAYVHNDTQVIHAGRGHTVIGHLDGQHQVLAEQIATTLTHAGLPATAVEDMEVRLWHKLVVNAAINPLVAQYRIRNGQLRDRPFSTMVEATLNELTQLMTALDIPAPQPDDPDSWRRLVWQVITNTANNRASMLQDVLAGRPTEYDAILGPLREAAIEQDIAIPWLDQLWQQWHFS
ncbi:ketopantoate reductase family protein [Halomonas binhaiensis]|uniref:2-dehydropantoate 2-reductase n=1 Tax=Halomonas binhaiensis TaxID=2562282 RepID=A0A5C1NEW5_9GAMM|nr:2-dehydropantoate 2-reductase [Halomonas binhaiensis]QEM81420.1 2-dehydropantoate 2-reductase [Halomonas binhaiensis]